MALSVANLWRYPVKTLAGEPLSSAVVGRDGIGGDRLVCVRGPEGVRTSRRQRDRLTPS
jgi:MOSC domain-containing protein